MVGGGAELRLGLLEVTAHAVFFFFGLLGGGAQLAHFIEAVFGRKDWEKSAHGSSLRMLVGRTECDEWASVSGLFG